MLELFKAGGWLMLPLLGCSIIAIAIIAERFWSLQQRRIAPPELITQIWQWLQFKQIDQYRINSLQKNSPLGQILPSLRWKVSEIRKHWPAVFLRHY